MGIVDIELANIRQALRSMYVMLSLDENQGDVTDTLIHFAPKFGLGEVKPKWDENRERYKWPWEVDAE